MITVEQLRSELIRSGLSEDEVKNIKGKQALKDRLNELGVKVDDQEIDVDFDNTTLEGNENIDREPDKIKYNDLGWQDYVMSQFTKEELDDGHPNIAGLRRVSELLLGPIVNSGPTEIYPSTDQNGPGRASVVFSVTFSPFLNEYDFREFRASADSYTGNTDDNYAIFPLAIAETRAEARALRRALKLNVASRDELTSKTIQVVETKSAEITWEPSELVGSPQITAINKLCERLDIDVDKFINSGDNKYKDISEVTKETALKIIERLNQYQSKECVVPDFIKKG